MKKNLVNKKFGRLVVISLLVVLLMMSATQAMVKFDTKHIDNVSKTTPPLSIPLLEDNYFTWEDLFNDATKIDPTMSYNYEVASGSVKMKNTYALWTDPAWIRMKPITITNNAGELLYNYAIHLTVTYDSDMRPDFGDIRFKHEGSGDVLCNYWLENYDSSSASFWVKIPYIPTGNSMMYLFYGNPSATSQSDFYGVFTDWEEHWPNDEQISYHSNNEGAWDADVAYGGGEFLVAWEEGQPWWPPYTWGFKQEIRASMYDPDGNRVVFDNLVYQDSTLYYRNENPSIDYGGGKFFVAWEHYDTVAHPSATTEDIKARTVVRNGNQLQLGTVINVCSAADCQADANVQFDSVHNRFCVVWEDARNGETNYNIYGRLYDTNGNPVGGEKNICTAANSQCEPWVAFDPIHGQYMIVWEEGLTADNGPFSLKAGVFDENLNQIGNTITVATGSDSVDYNFPCVEFSSETQCYLITYNNDDISSGDFWGNIWGMICDDTGNVVVDTFQIKSGEFVRTDIVPYLSSSFFVSFNSKAPESDSGLIWGKLVSSDGEVYTGEVQLSASTSAEADWGNMAVGNGKIFVAWEDVRVYYPSPWNDMSDAYGNIWHLNIPSGSEVTYSMGDEKTLLLEAQLTSIAIDPENLLAWYDFNAISEGTITFDILNGAGDTVLIQGINPGQSLQSLDPLAIRLRAHFIRSNPSYTPTLNSWTVRYIGLDEVPPVTTLDHISGSQGLNGWYTSEGVTVWLTSYDLPEGTGSGVNHTYYTLNDGPTQEYILGSGIPLVVTQETHWMGTWDVNFWSVDRSGNVEDNTQPDNTIQIKIDAERPYVEIKEPVDEQQVNLPFWVRANASDNAVVDRVEFDIEPFGQHPGLPYVDTEPPYEWFCNISEMNSGSKTPSDGAQSLGVNKMIRARVFDQSGQSWTHEVWVYIKNQGSFGKYFLIGFIKEKNDTGDTITFTARFLFSLTLDTIEPVIYKAGEHFIVSKDTKFGYIGPRVAIGFFEADVLQQ
ncbi:MAG: DUF2341 domain-containing protein [Thermoplasmata archaeon]|nr:DUF2341 domain-containing protein [Thermoplasmata archaeon]